jgi:hypothetical protein
MKSRCRNPKFTSYPYYGALGIDFCDQWETFDGFFADMGVCPSNKHSLERRNGLKGYCGENCTWATVVEQQNNKSSNIVLTAHGRSQTLMLWCRELGLNHNRVRMRIKRGETHERALSLSDDQFIVGSRLTHKANRSLTDEQVIEIRNSKLDHKAVSHTFNVSIDVIRNVRRHKTYTLLGA